ncbi:hypothetical protein ON010_g2381 [Phytophthora cinnamomi]|nr:hypothetical protein ON010_g2381 [Phytophthora cinnamomi]
MTQVAPSTASTDATVVIGAPKDYKTITKPDQISTDKTVATYDVLESAVYALVCFALVYGLVAAITLFGNCTVLCIGEFCGLMNLKATMDIGLWSGGPPKGLFCSAARSRTDLLEVSRPWIGHDGLSSLPTASLGLTVVNQQPSAPAPRPATLLVQCLLHKCCLCLSVTIIADDVPKTEERFQPRTLHWTTVPNTSLHPVDHPLGSGVAPPLAGVNMVYHSPIIPPQPKCTTATAHTLSNDSSGAFDCPERRDGGDLRTKRRQAAAAGPKLRRQDFYQAQGGSGHCLRAAGLRIRLRPRGCHCVLRGLVHAAPGVDSEHPPEDPILESAGSSPSLNSDRPSMNSQVAPASAIVAIAVEEDVTREKDYSYTRTGRSLTGVVAGQQTGMSSLPPTHASSTNLAFVEADLVAAAACRIAPTSLTCRIGKINPVSSFVDVFRSNPRMDSPTSTGCTVEQQLVRHWSPHRPPTAMTSSSRHVGRRGLDTQADAPRRDAVHSRVTGSSRRAHARLQVHQRRLLPAPGGDTNALRGWITHNLARREGQPGAGYKTPTTASSPLRDISANESSFCSPQILLQRSEVQQNFRAASTSCAASDCDLNTSIDRLAENTTATIRLRTTRGADDGAAWTGTDSSANSSTDSSTRGPPEELEGAATGHTPPEDGEAGDGDRCRCQLLAALLKFGSAELDFIDTVEDADGTRFYKLTVDRHLLKMVELLKKHQPKDDESDDSSETVAPTTVTPTTQPPTRGPSPCSDVGPNMAVNTMRHTTYTAASLRLALGRPNVQIWFHIPPHLAYQLLQMLMLATGANH